MAVTAALFAGTAATVATVTGIKATNRAAKAASNAARDQAATQTRLNEEFRSRQQVEEGQETAATVAASARQKQRKLAAAASGRGETILTSGAGVLGSASTERQSLLGL